MPPIPLSPADDARRCHWRLFLAVEGVLLLIAIAVTWAAVTFRPAKWVAIPIGVLWTWLVYTLPICVLYLIGRPPVITLSPLIPSAPSRAFRRELKARPALSDDQFYTQFYAGSDIPRDTTVRVRRCLLKIDPLTERAVPADCLVLLDEELDYGDVLELIGEEFRVRFTEADYPAVDGTLDNLIRLVQVRLVDGSWQ